MITRSVRWLLVFLLAGCSCDDDGPGVGGDGGSGTADAAIVDGGFGMDSAFGGADANGGDAGECGEIVAVVRDFDISHIDFQDDNTGFVRGLVEASLGADRKPVYAHGSMKRGGIENQTSFAEWYRDAPGTNQRFEVPLPLTELSPGRFVYDNPEFFPLDGLGFGQTCCDQGGMERNFHFTTEIHTSFTYQGGEAFTFRGDDDLWLFVDGQLVIDIGGVHGAIERTLRMDDLGLTRGATYPMDIFHAERHTSASNFRIETTIACFGAPILI